MQLLKNRVQELRLERKYSQELLCLACGISRQTLSSIENNEDYNPTLELAYKISNFLKCDITYVFIFNRELCDIEQDTILANYAFKQF